MKIYEPCYDPITHTYHDNGGMRLEGVTDILQGELGGFEGFPEGAAQRGTDVHNAIQYWNEGDLNEATLTKEIGAYLECFKRAKAHHGIKIIQNEVMRYHHKYRYAGRLDVIVEINGVVGVIDYKTGMPDKRNKWQLAMYLEFMRHEIPQIKGRWNLYLKPDHYDGSLGFKLEEHTGERDFLESLGLFTAYQIKKSNGYIKERRKIEQGE